MSDITSTAATTPGLTLADAKLHLNISSTLDDAVITSYIKAAVLTLENRTNRCFMWQTRVLRMNGFDDPRYVHDRAIYPARSPLKSVSSIGYYNTAGTTATVASSDYIVSTGDKPGRITESYSATWPNTYPRADSVVVTYVAGHSSVSTALPENIKHAVKMLVGHWFRNRESVVTGTISKEIEFGVDALLEGEHVERYG